MSQLALDLLQPLQPSFDNFVPGGNAEALATLQALARGALPERIVYLWGTPGCGRTHLLTALAGAGARWWTPQTAPEADGISVIDDVERLDAAAQIALFGRIDGVRANARAGCVATGSAPPAQLPLRADLRTRLGWGYVYQLRPLSDDEKAAALAAHAANRGVRFDPDVIPFLLTQLPRDMRTLVAALDALDAWALARKRALTLALAREWLASAAP